RMGTLASPSLRLFTTHQAPAPGGQSWHATCGSMMGSQSPRVSELTGQGLNSVMYAQSGNCAGARSPQVAKATIAQIATILGFMLDLSLHTENYTSTCNLLGGSVPETLPHVNRNARHIPSPNISVKNYMSYEVRGYWRRLAFRNYLSTMLPRPFKDLEWH